MQSLWSLKIDKIDELPSERAKEWHRFLEDFDSASSICIGRCSDKSGTSRLCCCFREMLRSRANAELKRFYKLVINPDPELAGFVVDENINWKLLSLPEHQILAAYGKLA
ncbi:hypothetical protein TNCV_896131 [Trichonephila clavipes]|nr:hypothetical protein TNCV_896131 [Trichonephila clavipes]